MAELYPADSWVQHNGQYVYWADLPRSERAAFAWKSEGAQWSHMFSSTWAEFKSDPLLPVYAQTLEPSSRAQDQLLAELRDARLWALH